MSQRDFLSTNAQQRCAEAIAEVELQTSAEVVVAVRRISGHYRHADYLVGFFCALGVLCALLFLPQEFHVAFFPIDVTVGFIVGAALCAWIAPLRRLVTGRRRRDARVRCAAREAFYELGISRTTGRTGLLVFVSLFERRVEVVQDIGVDPEGMGQPYVRAVAELRSAVAGQPDLEAFLAALRALGPVLGSALERAEDDVNELPDVVSTR